MGKNVAQKLIESHLVSGKTRPGEEISIKIDQTLTQDATGTMVMLELEAMGCKRVKTQISAQYVDHNLLEEDFKNADDHVFLHSACQRFGVWYSRAGNGVSHPVHMERFGIPGKTMVGSDSHTCAAGSMGMLAIGTGGLEVALSMMGQPFYFAMPKIWGVKLHGKLPPWVSAKDIILELLRRHDVDGGIGKIIEYYGPGLAQLTAMDRHVIANMGAELGATTSVFPADTQTKNFLKSQGRSKDFKELKADADAKYDVIENIDLTKLVPLIALPSSPGKVVPVKEVAGKEIYQAMIGSSANPGMRDFVMPALMLKGRHLPPGVSYEVNPTSRQILENLTKSGHLGVLIRAGARVHQAGCNGCIGMGQAPATGKISLRTVPRNFPGRSGTKKDLVYLCSPETATASAIRGVITDPRKLGMKYPKYKEPTKIIINTTALVAPKLAKGKKRPDLEMGPNIKPLPDFEEVKDRLHGPVLLKVGHNISTDEILPAGAKVLPFRSNIPEIAKFTFSQVDESYYKRAMDHQNTGSFIVGGTNYGQGSSREHAAITPRYLGVMAVIALGYARIHRDNLINFGIVPLLFDAEADYAAVSQGDVLVISDVHHSLEIGVNPVAFNESRSRPVRLHYELTLRERQTLLRGGLIRAVNGPKARVRRQK